jgi:hypothetical protein
MTQFDDQELTAKAIRSFRPEVGCASLCGARRGRADNAWRVGEAHIGRKN